MAVLLKLILTGFLETLIGIDMVSTKWFVMAPQGASQGTILNPVFPKGTVIISIQDNDPQYSTITALKPVTINGQQYIRFMGPFATLEQAKKAVPPSGLNFVKILAGVTVGAATSAATGNPPTGSTGVGNPLSGLDAIGAFFSTLTQANTWLRIGEGLLGIVLIGISLAKITGADNFIEKAVSKYA